LILKSYGENQYRSSPLAKAPNKEKESMSTNDKLGPLMRALVGVPGKMLGLLIDVVNRLSSEDGESFFTALAKFVQEWKKPVSSLLKFVGTCTTPATSEPFEAREEFKLKKDGGICSFLGDNFTAWFLNGIGRIDEPGGETALRFARLTKDEFDKPILDELGDTATIALVDVFANMEAQADGGEGDLLVDGRANIFYCLDQNNVLRAVSVYWYDGGWGVGAGSVDGPGGWFAGCQVFSRNSVLKSSVSQESATS